ncbi:MAG: hypothetical protein JW939_06875 [Candidatus Thermoplasmatota archaeon]|nr:hypothetical protein [Candidatus Thermoplasmatota archaeon]
MGGRWKKTSRTFSVVILGSLSFVLALCSASILETLTLSYTLFSAGMVPAVFLSPWKERIGLTSKGAIGSFMIGGGGVAILYISTRFGYWTGSLLYIPLTLSSASLLALSWILPDNAGLPSEQRPYVNKNGSGP